MVRGVTSELSFTSARSLRRMGGKSLGPDMIDVVVEAAPLGLNTRQDPQRALERLAIARWLDARRSTLDALVEYTHGRPALRLKRPWTDPSRPLAFSG
jgi:hypothetical protein